jgi:hypothetical protein
MTFRKPLQMKLWDSRPRQSKALTLKVKSQSLNKKCWRPDRRNKRKLLKNRYNANAYMVHVLSDSRRAIIVTTDGPAHIVTLRPTMRQSKTLTRTKRKTLLKMDSISRSKLPTSARLVKPKKSSQIQWLMKSQFTTSNTKSQFTTSNTKSQHTMPIMNRPKSIRIKVKFLTLRKSMTMTCGASVLTRDHSITNKNTLVK